MKNLWVKGSVCSAKSEELGSLKPGGEGGDVWYVSCVVCQLCDNLKITDDQRLLTSLHIDNLEFDLIMLCL